MLALTDCCFVLKKSQGLFKNLVTDCSNSICLIYHSLINFPSMSNYFESLGVRFFQMGNLSFWKVSQFIFIHAVYANPAYWGLLVVSHWKTQQQKNLSHTLYVRACLNVCFSCGIAKTGASCTTMLFHWPWNTSYLFVWLVCALPCALWTMQRLEERHNNKAAACNWDNTRRGAWIFVKTGTLTVQWK